MDRSSLLFCAGALLGSLLLAMLIYPLAAMTADEVVTANTPVESYEIDDLNLGSFGTVSVDELMTYYIENPPEPVTNGGGASRVEHFGGC